MNHHHKKTGNHRSLIEGRDTIQKKWIIKKTRKIKKKENHAESVHQRQKVEKNYQENRNASIKRKNGE